jgi:HD-GYP domain-containing protein (c-di-GMP phosphodiesterase class II)
MRLSDILRKKEQQVPSSEGKKEEFPIQEKKNPFLKKGLLEKLRQQNLLPVIDNNKDTLKKVFTPDSLDNIYGKAINNYKELFTTIFVNKKEKFSLKKIKSSVEEVVNLAKKGEDKFLLYCNYSTPDSYIFSHSINVAILTSFLSVEKKFSEEELFNTTLSAFLHDLGMLKVMSFANKPQKLTLSEYEEIKKHSLYIEEELSKIDIDLSVKKFLVNTITSVHERTDGSGYPRGLKDKDISVYSKIISIADIYEAMTHPRVYRKRILPHNALVELIQIAQTKLDSDLTKMFVNRISLFPIGSYVKLNTEEIGLVCGSNVGFPIRPKVKIMFNPDFTSAKQDVIDLSKESKIFILEAIDDSKIDTPDKKLLLQLKSQYWWVKNIV